MPKLKLVEEAPALLEQAQTGWLMLVYGYTWGAMFTEAYTRSRDSHMGIVIRLYPPDQDCLHKQLLSLASTRSRKHRPPPADGLLVWEVVYNAAPCYDYVTAKERTSGARLVSLSEMLAISDDILDVRLQPFELGPPGTCAISSRVDINNIMVSFAVEMSTRAFEDRWLVLFKVAYARPIW